MPPSFGSGLPSGPTAVARRAGMLVVLVTPRVVNGMQWTRLCARRLFEQATLVEDDVPGEWRWRKVGLVGHASTWGGWWRTLGNVMGRRVKKKRTGCLLSFAVYFFSQRTTT